MTIEYVEDDDDDYPYYVGIVSHKDGEDVCAAGVEREDDASVVVFDEALDRVLVLSPEHATDLAAVLTRAAELARRS